MKITSKSDYALIIMIELAKLKKGKVLPLGKIAGDYDLSLSYLEQLASKLKATKLISSKQGIKGGYYLTKKAQEIKPTAIIEAIGDEISPVVCCSADKSKKCRRVASCSAKNSWFILSEKIFLCLDSITLDQLI